MIPVTYPSSLSYRTTRQMVAYPITDLTGKRRWTDYIPVKFVDQTTSTVENSHNNNAYVAVDVLSSITGRREGIDYIPIYIDDAATDAWQVSATGYIPVGYSGAALSLQFAGATTLDSRITFTRASSATYFNNQGILTSAGNNVARFDHDPVTKAPRGLLIEEQRTNLLTYSEQFDNAAWVLSASTVTANQAISPDGTTSADKLIANTSNVNSHSVAQNISFTSGVTYTITVFAKAGEYGYANLVLPSTAFGTNQIGTFDLLTGASTVSVGSPTVSITSVGNGWYRCAITATATATATGDAGVRVNSTYSNAAYAGNGTSGIFIWGAQLEAGSFATSYIPTVAAQVTRSADSASMTGTNFSSWFRADAGTAYVEGTAATGIGAVSQAIASFTSSDINNTNRHVFFRSTAPNASYQVDAAGVAQAQLAPATWNNGSVVKLAGAFAVNDFAASANGSAVATDTSGSLPTVDRLIIGDTSSANRTWCGTIRKIAFYPARLTNGQLQALTA